MGKNFSKLMAIGLSACIMAASVPAAVRAENEQQEVESGYGQAEVIVSSSAGDRYRQLENLSFKKADAAVYKNYLKVNRNDKRQEFLGVGGAMTESAAYNIAKLSPEKQEEIFDAYFGKDGANYSLTRSSIGSADFSVKQYSYNDTTYPDENLKAFNIQGDRDYIIPALHRILERRPDVKFFAAPWAPPAWMKKSGIRRGQTGTAGLGIIDNSVLPQYYQSYADYFVKYIQAYKEEGINVYSLSMQNESQNNPKWEAATWTIDQTVDFVSNYLGPTLEKNGLDPELLIWDWDKGNDPMHKDGFIKFNDGVLRNPNARKYIDGIAFHWYAGDIWHEIAGKPMWSEDFYSLDVIREKYPDIDLHATEGCQEKGPWFGSYEPADRYTYDILKDFEHGVKSWIDWNLVLDMDGGPTQGVVNQCHAPVMTDGTSVYYQPSYYVLKQISRTVQPGTVSIGSVSDLDIPKTVVEDKEGNISVLMGNVTDDAINLEVIDEDRSVSVELKPHSITTLKYKNDYTPSDEIVIHDIVSVRPAAATATSYERNPIKNYQAASAIDGTDRTRWASDWKDRESITFELSARSIITGLQINFECGYDAGFEIQVSDDGVNFTTVKSFEKGQNADRLLDIECKPIIGKYIRMQGLERNNRYGYSIYEAQIAVGK